MLILASASPARHRLLLQAGIPHSVRVSGVDEESLHDPDPARLVQKLAEAKAMAVAQMLKADPSQAEAPTEASPGAAAPAGGSRPDGAEIAPVLGCDSLLVFEGEVFGKPEDAAQAEARWLRMAGRWAELLTGHVLINPSQRGCSDAEQSDGACRRTTVITRVRFATLLPEEIRDYVATGEPLQCAGGFALEGRGGPLVERIEGCFSNVIGLSLPLLRRWLKGQETVDP